MSPINEREPNNVELFANLEGLDRGRALLDKLKDLMPEEEFPEEPWSYGEYGQIVGTEYLPNLTMSVAMSGDKQIENCHSQLHRLIESEMLLCRFPEKLRSPSAEDFENLQNALDEFTDGMIQHISEPTSATDALKDKERQKIIRPAFTEISKQIKKLFTETRLRMTGDKDEYKNFWETQYSKYDEIRRLLGGQKDGQIVPDDKPDPLLKLLV